VDQGAITRLGLGNSVGDEACVNLLSGFAVEWSARTAMQPQTNTRP
jgi:hypothetical protein